MASFKAGNYVVNGSPGEQGETGGCHVYGSLGVVERIGFVGAADSERFGELCRLRSAGKF